MSLTGPDSARQLGLKALVAIVLKNTLSDNRLSHATHKNPMVPVLTNCAVSNRGACPDRNPYAMPAPIRDRHPTETRPILNNDHRVVWLNRIERRLKHPLPIDNAVIGACPFDRDTSGNPQGQVFPGLGRSIGSRLKEDHIATLGSLEGLGERSSICGWIIRLDTNCAHNRSF